MNIADRWALVAIMKAFLDQCRRYQSGSEEWQPFWSGEPVRFDAAGKIIELRVVDDLEAAAELIDEVVDWLGHLGPPANLN